MANATVSRLGQANTSGDAEAIFLKVFSGEVMTSFGEKVVTADKHMVRSISSGKSAQFAKVGRNSAAYHTPGAEIVGTAVPHNEVVISIDDLLISHSFIASIDEAMNHYDVRSVYSSEMGKALAEQYDRHVLQEICSAALTSSPTITAETGDVGLIVTDTDAATNADSLIQSVFDVAASFDDKGLPEDDRYVCMPPTQYYLLVNSSSKLINVDYGNAGNGSIAGGKVMDVAGMKIVKSTQIPTTNVSSGVAAGDGDARHAVDARNTVALAWHKSAVGTVKLLDLAVEKEYDIRRQGTLMVAKYAYGHGVLRPESAAQIRSAAP